MGTGDAPAILESTLDDSLLRRGIDQPSYVSAGHRWILLVPLVAVLVAAGLVGSSRMIADDAVSAPPTSATPIDDRSTATTAIAAAEPPPTGPQPLEILSDTMVDGGGRLIVVTPTGGYEVDLVRRTSRAVNTAASRFAGLAGAVVEPALGDRLLVQTPGRGRAHLISPNGDSYGVQRSPDGGEVAVGWDGRHHWYTDEPDDGTLGAQLYGTGAGGIIRTIRDVPTGSMVVGAGDGFVALHATGNVFVLDDAGSVTHRFPTGDVVADGTDWFLGYDCDQRLDCELTITDLPSGETTALGSDLRLAGPAVRSFSGTRLVFADPLGGRLLVVDADRRAVIDTGLPAVASGGFTFSATDDDILVVDAGTELLVHDLDSGSTMTVGLPETLGPRSVIATPDEWPSLPDAIG